MAPICMMQSIGRKNVEARRGCTVERRRFRKVLSNDYKVRWVEARQYRLLLLLIARVEELGVLLVTSTSELCLSGTLLGLEHVCIWAAREHAADFS